MGRAKRADEGGAIYHMLNRANRRATIFHKGADYEAFERILAEALDRVHLKLFAYCLMPNHWHLVVSPDIDGEMSRFGQWLGLTHTQRYNSHYQTTGEGHLYQGRYKSFPIQSDEHLLSVCRYVERNAYSAELCDSPELWKYGSLWRWRNGAATDKLLLSPWPIPRRSDWVQRVREPLTAKEQKRIQWCMQRGAPYGDDAWVESTARRCALESTLRPRGRPPATQRANKGT